MSGLKGLLSRNFRLLIALSVILDVVLLLSPSILQNLAWGYAILLPRWLAMIVGVQAVTWAYRDERIASSARQWLLAYLVAGFTLTGALNLLGTFRDWEF